MVSAPQCALDRIVILQKKATRHNHKLPLNHYTFSFFKSAEILKVPELYNHKLGIHRYKFATNLDQFIPPSCYSSCFYRTF